MSERESKVFKPRPKHLLPVVLGLLATGILAYPISLVGAPQAQVTPFVGDTVTSASLNAVVFVFALGASATVMFLLIRRGRMRFIRRLVKGALILVSFAVAFWYSTSLLASIVDLSTNLWTIVSLLLSLGIAAGIGLTVFGKGQTRQLSGVTSLGALTGVFLGYSLGATTAIVSFGLLSFFGTAVGILAGSYLGFRALSKYEMFPGLPFSLLLGVVGMLLTAAATGTLVF